MNAGRPAVDAVASDGRGPGTADGDDPGPRPRRHLAHERVVGVQDGHSPVRLGGQGLDELTFGLRDDLPGTELAQVRTADVEHCADPRPGYPGEVTDVPEAAGARLQDQESRAGGGEQHRVRVPELVVERPGGCNRRPDAREQLRDEVLGRRLAGGSGDADDSRAGQSPGDMRRERGDRRGRVGDLDARRGHRPGDDRCHRPGGDRGLDEVVAVDVLAGECEEEPAGSHLARIELHRGVDDSGRVGTSGEPAADDLGDLGERQRDHGFAARIARRSSSTSSNG